MVSKIDIQFRKDSNFIWIQLIFDQKPCFLGPSKLETPWPNTCLYQVVRNA